MSTAAEIAQSYLPGGTPLVDEEEEEKRRKAADEPESAEAIAASYLPDMSKYDTVVVEEEEPGFLERSGDTLVNAASDAMSVAMGDTYGEYSPDLLDPSAEPDPTQRTPLGGLEKTRRALGGFAQAVGTVAGDAAVSASDATGLSGVLAQIRDQAKENISKHPIYSDADPLGELSDAYNLIPEKDRASLEQAVAMSGMGLRTKSAPRIQGAVLPDASPLDRGLARSRASRGEAADANAAQALEQQLITERQNVLQPHNIKEQSNPGKVIEVGRNKRQTYVPVEYEQRVYDNVGEVPDFDPMESSRHNINAIEAEVNVLKEQLDKDLFSLDAIKATAVRADLDAALEDIKTNHLLVGNPGQTAKLVYEEYDRILERYTFGGDITARDLLQARRDLDAWVRKQSGGENKAFDATTQNATNIAVSKIRKSANDRVAAEVPDAKVKASLQKQSDLLTAQDHMYERDLTEGSSWSERKLRQADVSTPKTGLAIKANASDFWSMAITGTLAATKLLKRGAIMKGRKLKTNLIKATDAAINAGDEAAFMAIVTNEDSYEEGEE